MVARGDQGRFIAAKFKHFPCLTSSLVAKAMALHEGVEMAINYNWRTVEIESDCKNLAMAVNGLMGIPLKIDVLLANIHLFSRSLEVQFRFVLE
ncbi:hypothetical protein LIER_10993 [Lithospermum erythrorhizon]|uniref:RNase H type-1 domain-containing protein n=1 Tax=Lithospermum erythrorhizon TaxID=34254 RepID=A0AAV3PQQ0_LITER